MENWDKLTKYSLSLSWGQVTKIDLNISFATNMIGINTDATEIYPRQVENQRCAAAKLTEFREITKF